MASIAGATKTVACTVCGQLITVSLYANAKLVKCKQCKKTGAKAPKPTFQDGKLMKMIDDQKKSVIPDKPVQVQLIRNRSEIEANIIMDTGEIVPRIPASWKKIENELDYLSVSKIQTYEQCPAKFFNTYMNIADPESDEDSNIFTWFGTILHEVMEIAVKAHSESGILLNPLALYDEAWKKRELTDLQMYREGRELILDYFQRNPVNKNTDKVIATEFEWRGRLPGIDDIDFGCMIDYTAEVSPEVAKIKDYKSNRHPYTPWELENSLQLGSYEIIGRMLWPQYKQWITGYEMFRFGWQPTPPRTDADREAILAYIKNIWYQIKHDQIFRERLNDYCAYCKRKAVCKSYCDLINDPKRMIDTIITDMTDLSSIEKSRELLNTYEKIISGRKDELAGMVKKAVEHATMCGQKIVVDEQEIYLQAQSRPSYDYSATASVLAVAGKLHILDDCISVNKTKLDNATKNDPHLKLGLSSCLIQNYSAPYIMKRKVKK